ncbi:MAG TPA: branched-chain amino acid ABC transporter permease [Castellaniella sp.]|uniref:branched-chain amino acid ABC transporter permease n=1 Tax=Castellaniella sp. TaxID=1955812 RepID=UPI002F2334CF
MLYRENGQFKSSYRSDQQIFPILQDRWFVAALLVVAFAVVPLGASEYFLQAVFIPFLILALAAIGLNVLVGYCGQISIGSGAFMAVGAYAAWNFGVRIPALPLVVQILLGGVLAMVAGVVFGVPSLRIRGLYLAVTTLAAQFFMDWAFLRIPYLTNNSTSGNVSVPALEAFGLPVETPAQKYLFVLCFVVVIGVLTKNLVRGAIGRQWMAIRDMDVAAAVIGIRPVYAKLTAFAVSSFIIGVAGALWAYIHLGSWEPLAFDLNRSLELLFIIIIGGLGSVIGSFFGAAFMVLVPILLTNVPHLVGFSLPVDLAAHINHMVFGFLIVFFLIVEPHGLARLWSIAKEKLRIWPFPH